MLSKKLNQALNTQMNRELASSYAYLSTASYFDEEELTGFANFFKIQAQEELQHAMRIYNYLHTAGGSTDLEEIPAPKKHYSSPVDAFESGLKQEETLSVDISKLLEMATSERHAPTQVFLQWFINEQLEEEALFTRCIKRLKLVGKDPNGILTMDNEFAARKIDAAADEGAAE